MKLKITLFIICFCARSFSYAQPSIQWQKCLGRGPGIDGSNSLQHTNDGGFIVAGYSTSNSGDVTGNHGGYDYWIVKLDSSRTIQWQKCLGGSADDIPSSIQQTSDSGFLVVGQTTSTDGDVIVNHGFQDLWVVKLDNSGIIQWQKSLGGSSYEGPNSLGQATSFAMQTIDGGYIITTATQSNDGDVSGNHGTYDYWVVKLNATGVIQWQKCLGGSGYDVPTCIQQTSDKGYIIAGWSISNNGDITANHISFWGWGGVYSDFWIVKLDSIGTIQWQRSLGGSSEDRANYIQQTLDHGYVAVGISESRDGDVDEQNTTGGSGDVWVVKLDSIGNIQWRKSLGGSGDDGGTSVQQTSDGEYIVSGWSSTSDSDVTSCNGIYDYWIVKLDQNGIKEWQKSLGGSNLDLANSICQDGIGYIASGFSHSNDSDVIGSHGGGDFWIVKVSPNHLYDCTIVTTMMEPNSILGQSPFSVTGKIVNLGADTITFFTINYRINNGPVISGNINSAGIHPLSGYTFASPVPWVPSSVGTYQIDLWATNLNGHNDEDSTNDHFVFNVNVVDTFVVRNTLVEDFTASWCNPCVAGDFYLDTLLIPVINHYSMIKYHYGTNDLYSTTVSMNRALYYPIGGIPESAVDGQIIGTSYYLNPILFNSYQSRPAFMSIDISSASYSDTTVYVSGTIRPLINYDTGAYYYQVVVIEKENHLHPGSNGETVFRNVMIKMSPNDTGTYIPSLTANNPISFNQTISLSCCTSNVESMNDLKVVVFVQNNNDKKIQQSAWKDVTLATSITNIENESEGIVVYPNPSDKTITVIVNEEKGELKLYDFLGKEVLLKSVEGEKQIILDISFLPSGIYFLRMNTSKGMYASKIIKE